MKHCRVSVLLYVTLTLVFRLPRLSRGKWWMRQLTALLRITVSWPAASFRRLL